MQIHDFLLVLLRKMFGISKRYVLYIPYVIILLYKIMEYLHENKQI